MTLAHVTELLQDWMPQIFDAAFHTIRMAVAAYVVGAVFGLVVALAGLSKRRIFSTPARIYIELIRGTPTLTQLFLIYYGLTNVGIVLPSFHAAVVALGLHYAAYMAETYRSGIEAVARGQVEAAMAIGMTKREAMRHIVLPQSIRVILPPMANSAISLLKDTSVASLVSAPEIMLRTHELTSEYFMPMQLYLIAAVMYFVMAYPLALGVRRLEKRMSKGHRH